MEEKLKVLIDRSKAVRTVAKMRSDRASEKASNLEEQVDAVCAWSHAIVLESSLTRLFGAMGKVSPEVLENRVELFENDLLELERACPAPFVPIPLPASPYKAETDTDEDVFFREFGFPSFGKRSN